MELINEKFLGEDLVLQANMAGWQQLHWNGQLVATQNASAEAPEKIHHQFELQSEQGTIVCEVEMTLRWQPFHFDYTVSANGSPLHSDTRTQAQLAATTPSHPVPARAQFSVVGLASLGLKLLKSAKVVKVLLVGASVAAYSWLFSLPFALLLILCLVIHEYGHIRAMKHFGMRTKGIYLIPFVGGLAVGESNLNTRWQSVVISIMGPVFGLFLSLAATLAYLVTGQPIFAGLAGFNALLNLFNLLPILPLDGGHILKAITFSMHNTVGLVLCIAGALLGVVLCYTFGLTLLGFLLLIGSAEIFFEWRHRYHTRLLPLDRYGQIFSSIWYLAVVAGFIAIIWFFASTGDAILGLPMEVLRS